MKVALVHDHLAQNGGAEKVLKVFADMFKDAPIYTLLYEKNEVDKYLKGRQIEASIIKNCLAESSIINGICILCL
jgi:hypothetical protein